jgi:hypothetical protein
MAREQQLTLELERVGQHGAGPADKDLPSIAYVFILHQADIRKVSLRDADRTSAQLGTRVLESPFGPETRPRGPRFKACAANALISACRSGHDISAQTDLIGLPWLMIGGEPSAAHIEAGTRRILTRGPHGDGRPWGAVTSPRDAEKGSHRLCAWPSAVPAWAAGTQ